MRRGVPRFGASSVAAAGTIIISLSRLVELERDVADPAATDLESTKWMSQFYFTS
jgi:hypothetical protein